MAAGQMDVTNSGFLGQETATLGDICDYTKRGILYLQPPLLLRPIFFFFFFFLLHQKAPCVESIMSVQELTILLQHSVGQICVTLPPSLCFCFIYVYTFFPLPNVLLFLHKCHQHIICYIIFGYLFFAICRKQKKLILLGVLFQC